MTLQKWLPEPNAHYQRRIGKTLEELGELTAVLGRCAIQGIESIDPSSGESNRYRLEKEIADVMAQCEETINVLNLNFAFIGLRIVEKMRQMEEWELLLLTND